MNNEDIGANVVSIAFRTGRISSQVVYDVLGTFYRQLAKQRQTGKQSLKMLVKSGHTIKPQDIRLNAQGVKEFDRAAKALKLDYALVRNPHDPEQYTFFFRAQDEYLVRKLLQNHLAKLETARDTRQSVQEKLNQIKAAQKAAALENPDRAMHKERARGVER